MRDGGHVLAGMQANCTEGSFAPKTEMIEAAGARFLDARESIGAAEFPSRGEQDGPWSRLASWKKGLEQDIGEGRGGIPGTRCEQRAGGARGVPYSLLEAGGASSGFLTHSTALVCPYRAMGTLRAGLSYPFLSPSTQ